MAKRSSANESKIQTGAWITTYADLMNNLLVFFMLLYVMSIIDLQKFQKMSNSFVETFLGTTPEIITGTPAPSIIYEYITIDPEASVTPEPSVTPDISPTPKPENQEEYDELFSRINLLVEQKGYSDMVNIEKKSDIIYLRFREGVFFYPDQAELKQDAYPIIKNISGIIMGSYDLIAGIDISGHTAKVSKSPPSKTNLFSWELSTNRALTVLRYLVQHCDMPQEKLSVTGYSNNQLYIEGEEEEFLAQNRRVEIRLSRTTNMSENDDIVNEQ